MREKFTRMSSNDDLVEKLKKSLWWGRMLRILESNSDMNVQVRGHYLNIYYKMNNFLRVSLERDVIKCSMHYKFMPLIKPKNNYITLMSHGAALNMPGLSGTGQRTISGDILDKNNLELVKRQIEPYVSKEKKHQSFFIRKNKGTIIDAEVAFNESDDALGTAEEEKSRTRIDLINYDKNLKKIVAIELKMILDERLYNGKIINQLEKYRSFLKNNKNDIRQAYSNAQKTKIALGLLNIDKSELAIVDFGTIEVVEEPILAVVCYNQKIIDCLGDEVRKAAKGHALRVFFFGKDGDLNIPGRAGLKNKDVFL